MKTGRPSWGAYVACGVCFVLASVVFVGLSILLYRMVKADRVTVLRVSEAAAV